MVNNYCYNIEDGTSTVVTRAEAKLWSFLLTVKLLVDCYADLFTDNAEEVFVELLATGDYFFLEQYSTFLVLVFHCCDPPHASRNLRGNLKKELVPVLRYIVELFETIEALFALFWRFGVANLQHYRFVNCFCFIVSLVPSC